MILATTIIMLKACEENTTEPIQVQVMSFIEVPNRNPSCPEGQREYRGKCRQVV